MPFLYESTGVETFFRDERDPAPRTDRKFDIAGVLTVTGAVTLLVLALVQGPEVGWGSPAIVFAIVAGLFSNERLRFINAAALRKVPRYVSRHSR